MSKRRVAYYHDPDVGAFTYGLGHPMKPQRMRITHELVSAYGMLDHMQVLRAKRASAEEMTRFHTDEYIHFLSRVIPETAEEMTFHGTRFLMGDDNPPFEGVFDFCALSAGGSIEAGQRLASGATDIAINWAGGLHHAKKREASGFCYVNDIVLGILELLRVFPRVLYIDIDCHHGDGVEEAFYTTDRVMTCSFHKFGEYFPGTGTQDDRGRGAGKGYAVNVPFKDGLTDDAFKSVFEPVITKIMDVFQPSAIVLQCGADSLAGDKLGCFNITMQGHANCVQFVRKLNVPLMILGGGGYTVKNVARAWVYETACALGIEDTIDFNLPWHEYFEWFGPRYRLEVLANNMDDLNVKDKSLDKVRETTLRQLSELIPVPSVGLHDVPSETVGDHLGFRHKESKNVDSLDERLAQHMRFVYGLQDSSSTSSESDPESESDRSSSSRTINRSSRRQRARNGKKRMSITTNQTFEIPDAHTAHQQPWALPTAKGAKRRFFQSEGARWDEKLRKVVVAVSGETEGVAVNGRVRGTGVENGLGNGTESVLDEEDVMDVEDDEEDR
ncbi:histone deacetylase RPD3 [Cristinia sonorae]|uniref:histone deacetylase n=1 Tax=Cristinia sonorae TaxID=1940300 RepID=A0A8K0URK0_9AGAR|nr:histone deacetylase RPD3 [Cristinia sonorae]